MSIEDDTTSCTSYNITTFDFFIPSLNTFSNLCVSYDKTEMFIASVVRLIIHLSILYWLENDEESNDDGIPTFFIKKWIYYIVSVLTVINLIVIGIVVAKIPKYNKKTLQ